MAGLNIKINKNHGELQNEFINELNKVEKEIVGNESYGETTEFYDESGVVLLTVYPDENNPGALVFKFFESNSEYSILEGNFKKD